MRRPLSLLRLTEAGRRLVSALRGPAAFPAGPSPELDRLNDHFHESYDAARARAELAAPVLVLFGDSLFVQRGRRRVERPFTPELFHGIKSVAHVPIALFSMLEDTVDRRFSASTRRGLGEVRARVTAAVPEPSDESADDVRATLSACLSFLDRILDRGVVAASDLSTFAATTGPILLRLTEHATRVQLAALHRVVEHELSAFGPEERRGLQVVVAGDHQARVRSLGMQYFQKRLGESPSAETRVTYAEGLAGVDQAVELVGKRRLDRAIARAFFGNERKLQQDVLGDAAAALLARADLRPFDR